MTARGVGGADSNPDAPHTHQGQAASVLPPQGPHPGHREETGGDRHRARGYVTP